MERCGDDKAGVVIKGYRISFGGREIVLTISGDGCTIW
jgi:hypothetical protein